MLFDLSWLRASCVLDGWASEKVTFFEVLDSLLPEEIAEIHCARRKRQLEYSAGRHCAHRALMRLNAPSEPLLNGADRAPCWPEGFIGSITHTGQDRFFWAGAVVGRQDRIGAIGIDAELSSPLPCNLWRLILIPQELQYIEQYPANQRGLLAKIIFSAKESFYKTQYIFSRTFLDFQDAHVELRYDQNSFRATLLRAAGALSPGWRMEGSFLALPELILTGIMAPTCNVLTSVYTPELRKS